MSAKNAKLVRKYLKYKPSKPRKYEEINIKEEQGLLYTSTVINNTDSPRADYQSLKRSIKKGEVKYVDLKK